MWDVLGKRILWLRARDYLRRYQPKLIGVAGSAYTTVTQNAIAAALKPHHRVRQAEQFVSSPIDVAYAVLGMQSAAHRHWWPRILAGSRIRELREEEPEIIITDLPLMKPGDIDTVATALPFAMSVVTTVHTAHMSLFTNKETIAHEIASIVTVVPPEGYVILNADDALVAAMQQHTKAHILSFGNAAGATVSLRRHERLASYGLTCEVAMKGKLYELYLPHIIGRHQLPAILAALAVTVALDSNSADALQHLSNLIPPPGQLRLLDGIKGSRILDDSYDATPESMIDALTTLHEIHATRSLGGDRRIGRRIAILGDVIDAGATSQRLLTEIGQRAAASASIVIAVGETTRTAGAEALRVGADVHHFTSSSDVGKWLAPFLKEGDCVLVCGSRIARMEKVVRRLLANPDKDAHLLVSGAAR